MMRLVSSVDISPAGRRSSVLAGTVHFHDFFSLRLGPFSALDSDMWCMLFKHDFGENGMSGLQRDKSPIGRTAMKRFSLGRRALTLVIQPTVYSLRIPQFWEQQRPFFLLVARRSSLFHHRCWAITQIPDERRKCGHTYPLRFQLRKRELRRRGGKDEKKKKEKKTI